MSNKVRLVASLLEDDVIYPSGIYEVKDLPKSDLFKRFTVDVTELPNTPEAEQVVNEINTPEPILEHESEVKSDPKVESQLKAKTEAKAKV